MTTVVKVNGQEVTGWRRRAFLALGYLMAALGVLIAVVALIFGMMVTILVIGLTIILIPVAVLAGAVREWRR